MVLLFSERKNKEEMEIIKILNNYGASYVSDKTVTEGKNKFTVISLYKKTDVNLEKGVVVLLGNSKKFESLRFKGNITGICDGSNQKTLDIFSNSPITVISCGMGRRNTVTASSITKENVLISIQRCFNDINGNTIEPLELKIRLKDNYKDFSIMASVTILLLYGIKPDIL